MSSIRQFAIIFLFSFPLITAAQISSSSRPPTPAPVVDAPQTDLFKRLRQIHNLDEQLKKAISDKNADRVRSLLTEIENTRRPSRYSGPAKLRRVPNFELNPPQQATVRSGESYLNSLRQNAKASGEDLGKEYSQCEAMIKESEIRRGGGLTTDEPEVVDSQLDAVQQLTTEINEKNLELNRLRLQMRDAEVEAREHRRRYTQAARLGQVSGKELRELRTQSDEAVRRHRVLESTYRQQNNRGDMRRHLEARKQYPGSIGLFIEKYGGIDKVAKYRLKDGNTLELYYLHGKVRAYKIKKTETLELLPESPSISNSDHMNFLSKSCKIESSMSSVRGRPEGYIFTTGKYCNQLSRVKELYQQIESEESKIPETNLSSINRHKACELTGGRTHPQGILRCMCPGDRTRASNMRERLQVGYDGWTETCTGMNAFREARAELEKIYSETGAFATRKSDTAHQEKICDQFKDQYDISYQPQNGSDSSIKGSQ